MPTMNVNRCLVTSCEGQSLTTQSNRSATSVISYGRQVPHWGIFVKLSVSPHRDIPTHLSLLPSDPQYVFLGRSPYPDGVDGCSRF